MKRLRLVFSVCVFFAIPLHAEGLHHLQVISPVAKMRYAADVVRTVSKALNESPLMQGKQEISLAILKDGKTPEVRLFEDQGDIAYRINKLYFKHPKAERFVKSRFLGIRFKALDANGDRLQLTVVGDPNEMVFKTEISRSELESGKEIKLKEHKKKSVPFLADAYADSSITLKWNPQTKTLDIPYINGRMEVDSFVIGDGASEKSIENLTTVRSDERIAMPPFSK